MDIKQFIEEKQILLPGGVYVLRCEDVRQLLKEVAEEQRKQDFEYWAGGNQVKDFIEDFPLVVQPSDKTVTDVKMPEYCEWIYQDGSWGHKCRNGLPDNLELDYNLDYNFCPFCSKPIKFNKE
jgi:hypothetical protein